MCFNNYNCKKQKKDQEECYPLPPPPSPSLSYWNEPTNFLCPPPHPSPSLCFPSLTVYITEPTPVRLHCTSLRLLLFTVCVWMCECVCSHWDYHHRGWYNLLVETQWTLQPVPTFIILLRHTCFDLYCMHTHVQALNNLHFPKLLPKTIQTPRYLHMGLMRVRVWLWVFVRYIFDVWVSDRICVNLNCTPQQFFPWTFLPHCQCVLQVALWYFGPTGCHSCTVSHRLVKNFGCVAFFFSNTIST